MSQRFLTLLRLFKRSSDPTGSQADLYFNTSDRMMHVHDGNGWTKVGTTDTALWKEPVRVMARADIDTAAPGTDIDQGQDGASIVMEVGDRVLLNGQSFVHENGIWVYNGAAVPMTRATDFDTNAKIASGMAVVVLAGFYTGTIWTAYVTTPFDLNTNPLWFQQVDSPQFEATDGTPGNDIFVGEWEPSAPRVGDLWFDEVTPDEDVYLDYTPTFATITKGNGVLSARYCKQGHRVHVHFRLVWGTTTTVAAGTMLVSLPIVPLIASTTDAIGIAYFFDASAGSGSRSIGVVSCTAGGVYFNGAGPGGTITNLVPWTWAVGDVLSFDAHYEVA